MINDMRNNNFDTNTKSIPFLDLPFSITSPLPFIEMLESNPPSLTEAEALLTLLVAAIGNNRMFSTTNLDLGTNKT